MHRPLRALAASDEESKHYFRSQRVCSLGGLALRLRHFLNTSSFNVSLEPINIGLVDLVAGAHNFTNGGLKPTTFLSS